MFDEIGAIKTKCSLIRAMTEALNTVFDRSRRSLDAGHCGYHKLIGLLTRMNDAVSSQRLLIRHIDGLVARDENLIELQSALKSLRDSAAEYDESAGEFAGCVMDENAAPWQLRAPGLDQGVVFRDQEQMKGEVEAIKESNGQLTVCIDDLGRSILGVLTSREEQDGSRVMPP